MKKQQFKPTMGLVLSLEKGESYDSVVIDGILYISTGIEAPQGGTSNADLAPSKPSGQPVASTQKESKATTYTEEELMQMDAVEELLPMCKKLGITVPAEGRNTNAKLRKLILAHQEEGGGAPEEEAPSGRATAAASDSTYEDVLAVLKKLDKNKIDAETAEEELVTLAGNGAVKHLKTFIKDSSKTPEEIAELIAGEGSANAAEAPARRGAGKPQAKAKVILTPDRYDELEVGQRVSVYWAEQQDWFEGTVGEVTRKGVTVDYDDNTSAVLNEDETPEVEVIG